MARFNLSADDHESEGLGGVVCVTLGQSNESVEPRADACRQFVIAAQQLLDVADLDPIEPRTNNLTGNPICFLIRHAVELALKVAVPAKGHRLDERLHKVLAVGRELGLADPLGLMRVVDDFHTADPTGALFRYASEEDRTCCVNPADLRADIATILSALDDYLVRVGQHTDGAM